MAKTKTETKKIIWIEDDESLIDIYKTTLEAEKNFDVKFIKLGYDAIDLFKKIKDNQAEKPDLIILDLILPDINGIEVLEEMRKIEGAENMPVSILTNYTNKQAKETSEDLKCEKYLIKTDWSPSKIVSLIKKELKTI